MYFLNEISRNSWGTWNNFAQFHCNFSLSSLVILQSELIDDLSSIFWSVLHGIHSCTLLRGKIVQISMIQYGVNVELIEEVGSMVKIRFLGIMLDNVSETFQELFFVEHFSLFQNLTDYVFELIINNNNSITIFSML